MLADKSANVAVTFSIALPVLLMISGLAVDFGNASASRAKLQSVADSAALAAARELRLASTTAGTATEVAKRVVEANSGAAAGIVFQGAAVGHEAFTVKLQQDIPTYLLHVLDQTFTRVAVEARANVLGGSPVCLIGLDDTADSTVEVKDAKLSAPKCTVYSNSTSADGLATADSGSVKAAFICSSGGVQGGGFSPAPELDCPPAPDPLSSRPAPKVGGCTKTGFVANGGIRVLFPGVYCGGLKLTGNAVATLIPGEYIIKDGPLVVDNGAILTGVGVGFYLTGSNATFDFDPTTTVNLTAPIAGSLAGMLFFEDRSAAESTHRMLSRNAPVLLGTFYLSQSLLQVGAPGGPGLLSAVVGALSAWTIVVARRVSINDKLNLTLNTNYSGSQVPVPDGVGPYGASVVLSK